MIIFLAFLVVICNTVSIIRLFSYRCLGRSRKSISLAAGLLITCLFAQIIYAITSGELAFYDIGFSALIMSALLASRGNVACFFNGEHEHA